MAEEWTVEEKSKKVTSIRRRRRHGLARAVAWIRKAADQGHAGRAGLSAWCMHRRRWSGTRCTYSQAAEQGDNVAQAQFALSPNR